MADNPTDIDRMWTIAARVCELRGITKDDRLLERMAWLGLQGIRRVPLPGHEQEAAVADEMIKALGSDKHG